MVSEKERKKEKKGRRGGGEKKKKVLGRIQKLKNQNNDSFPGQDWPRKKITRKMKKTSIFCGKDQ